MFYVFVLYEIHVKGVRLVYNYVWIGNIQENIPKDKPRVLEEGPKLEVKTVPVSPKRRRHQWFVGLSTPCQLVPLVGN